MVALAVDDEPLMLTALVNAISASPDIQNVVQFTSCRAALTWAQSNRIDVAFLDINMRGMGGIALAKALQELHHEIKIIFCTGHSEYAIDAFQLHVSGYLLKPITSVAVQRELDQINHKKQRGGKLLSFRCFGEFEVFCKGQPLAFKRSLTKEVLAVLVDYHGARASTRAICTCLWPEGAADTKTVNYLYQLLSDLRTTLQNNGAYSVLLRPDSRSYALDTDKVDCDYYDYLRYGTPEFMGSYMSQYSWADVTCSELLNKQNKQGL